MQLEAIEQLTKTYAAARTMLADRVGALEDEITTSKRARMRGIKTAVAAAAEAEQALRNAIEANAHLFTKPRTHVFHGVKVGMAKGKGELSFESNEQVCKLIHKHFAEQSDVLINIKESPVKKALAQLSAAELKRIGVTVIETGDQCVIRPTDSEVDKVVNALLKDAQALDEANAE